jgi:hypothetical protein
MIQDLIFFSWTPQVQSPKLGATHDMDTLILMFQTQKIIQNQISRGIDKIFFKTSPKFFLTSKTNFTILGIAF